ncbi:MAG: TerC family protein [Oligoflexia bacterium]|nr:TerC family protein [Oligoflexia bacterium]MBF0365495.1 TerC family protein [Oligoflexia bacterium]
MLPWIIFHVIVVALLAFDLFVLHKKPHEIKFKEALFWSAVYVALALLFNAGIFAFRGPVTALEFLSGYLIEISLSIDNLFVFLSIFTIFSVPRLYQHRVLFWGIVGAVVMRAVFIFAGLSLISAFHWMIYIFGAFLVITGIKFLFHNDEEAIDPKNYWPIKLAKRWLPFTDCYDGGHFFVKSPDGLRWLGTPLFLVLIVIDIVDIIFAVDSVPAVIAVTKDPFIVYTSNIFAILGLRSMYFALAGLMPLFHYLKYALSFILIFVGFKLALADIYHIHNLLSLGIIASLLGLSIVASLLFAPKTAPTERS